MNKYISTTMYVYLHFDKIPLKHRCGEFYILQHYTAHINSLGTVLVCDNTNTIIERL